MKTLFLFLTLSLFSSSIFACEVGEVAFPKADLCAKILWVEGPAYNQYSTIEVTLNKETPLKLNVIPWMVMGGGHEHGSRNVKMTAYSSTNYSVEKIYFMGGMVGDWFLRFQLLNDQNIVTEEVRSLVELAE